MVWVKPMVDPIVTGKPLPPSEEVEVVVLAATYSHREDGSVKTANYGDTIRISKRTYEAQRNAFRLTSELEDSPVSFPTTDVGGIGRLQAKKLAANNVITLEDLAEAKVADIARFLGINESEAKVFIEEAAVLARDAAKNPIKPTLAPGTKVVATTSRGGRTTDARPPVATTDEE